MYFPASGKKCLNTVIPPSRPRYVLFTCIAYFRHSRCLSIFSERCELTKYMFWGNQHIYICKKKQGSR